MLEPYGIDCTWEDYRVHGLGVDDVEMCDLIQRRRPHVNVSELLGRNAERKQFVCELSLAQLPIPREAIVFLATLNKYRLGLVTSSERAIVEPVLCACKLLDRFDARVFDGISLKRRNMRQFSYRNGHPFICLIQRQIGILARHSSPEPSKEGIVNAAVRRPGSIQRVGLRDNATCKQVAVRQNSAPRD